jgi:methionine aminopeptidase
MSIILKTPDEIEKMRVACRLAAEVLDYITPFVKPGVTTGESWTSCATTTWSTSRAAFQHR